MLDYHGHASMYLGAFDRLYEFGVTVNRQMEIFKQAGGHAFITGWLLCESEMQKGRKPMNRMNARMVPAQLPDHSTPKLLSPRKF